MVRRSRRRTENASNRKRQNGRENGMAKWLTTALTASFQMLMCAFGATTTIGGITWRYTISNNKISLGETVMTDSGECWSSWETYPAVPISTTGEITIPSTINGMRVVDIGQCAFQNCTGLTKVTIPATTYVTNIDDYAFCNCTGLLSISIPSYVKRIGNSAFEDCTGLTNATIGSSIIGSWAFNGCKKLSSVHLDSHVTTINHRAFARCASLSDMIIPSTVKYMDGDVFLYSPDDGDDEPQTPFGLKLEATKEIMANRVLSGEITLESPNQRYDLATSQADRAIATVTINADTTLSNFTLINGKVYDTILRIVNTADKDVRVTLPNGYEYETIKGATPLTIPANSRNILTITRTADNVFLVSRRELETVP